jgi:hypothetical protein
MASEETKASHVTDFYYRDDAGKVYSAPSVRSQADHDREATNNRLRRVAREHRAKHTSSTRPEMRQGLPDSSGHSR